MTQAPHWSAELIAEIALWVSALGLVLSAIGWVVTYQLNVRANKDLLRRTILNASRDEVCKAITEYVDWCSDVVARLGSLEIRRNIAWELGTPEGFRSALAELRIVALTDPRSFKWARGLE